MAENTVSEGVSRRAIVKGAAWSLPVVAVAVATPFASASAAPFNATVTGNCSNDYDLSALTNLVGAGLVGIAQTALTGLGLTAGATRMFTVTATSGTIPAGTTYTLSDPNALLTVSGLEAVIDAGVAGIASTAGGFVLTLTAPITEGNSFTVDVYRALVNVGAASGFTLTQNVTDSDPSDNSDTMNSLLAAAVNLNDLNPLLSGTLAVQTCA